MDTESLKSLLSILLWGGFFFLMMRYGCGAHMMGGHGRHGSPDKSAETKDPVCGMTVGPQGAAAASVLGGNTYYFCSTSCRDKFDQNPATYATQAASGHKQTQGGCHG